MSPPSPPGTTFGTLPMVLILPFRTDLRRALSRSLITAVPSGRNTVDHGSCSPSMVVRTLGSPAAAGALGDVWRGLPVVAGVETEGTAVLGRALATPVSPPVTAVGPALPLVAVQPASTSTSVRPAAHARAIAGPRRGVRQKS